MGSGGQDGKRNGSSRNCKVQTKAICNLKLSAANDGKLAALDAVAEEYLRLAQCYGDGLIETESRAPDKYGALAALRLAAGVWHRSVVVFQRANPSASLGGVVYPGQHQRGRGGEKPDANLRLLAAYLDVGQRPAGTGAAAPVQERLVHPGRVRDLVQERDAQQTGGGVVCHLRRQTPQPQSQSQAGRRGGHRHGRGGDHLRGRTLRHLRPGGARATGENGRQTAAQAETERLFDQEGLADC